MTRISKGTSYQKINSANADYIDTNGFKKFKSQKLSSGAITIIRSGSGHRVRLSPTVYETLDNPTEVNIAFDQNKMVISTASEGSGEATVKQGRIIYDSELANMIMDLNPEIDYDAKGSTPCGTVTQAQVTDDGKSEVIICF